MQPPYRPSMPGVPRPPVMVNVPVSHTASLDAAHLHVPSAGMHPVQPPMQYSPGSSVSNAAFNAPIYPVVSASPVDANQQPSFHQRFAAPARNYGSGVYPPTTQRHSNVGGGAPVPPSLPVPPVPVSILVGIVSLLHLYLGVVLECLHFSLVAILRSLW